MSQNKAADAAKTGGKYGAMIQKARNLENQQTRMPDSQMKDDAAASSALEKADQETRKPGNQNAGSPMKQKESGKKEEEVNLSIKVPKRLRRHWVAEAKRRDTSLTAIITAALKQELGEPGEG